ncbi:Carboxylesterase family protein [Thiorhodovibrio winogradskyi]|uniref:Carboxylesterase family protein n=1 Tax=Thiorhodovibrio winogradskyi TaxID=77007 RepID=A0ABZ0S615_9GAMM|nr:alpha/beta hydrolase [Thiorhodovibrio winogradskyi]
MTALPHAVRPRALLVERNIRYRDADGCDPDAVSLDIYYEKPKPKDEKRAMIVFVHGGGWDGGDKACFLASDQEKMPGYFVSKGYVFASVNYRLGGTPTSSGVGIPEMAADIAKAIKWLSVNGRRYGGRQTGFVLIGYSSGAHLALLVATDQQYLRHFRLMPDTLSAVIVLDMTHFDIPMTMRIMETKATGLPNQEQRLAHLYKIFGQETAGQAALSPANHLGSWLTRTAVLIVSVGLCFGHRQWLTKRMGENFQRRLEAIGVRVEHLHLEEWEHNYLVTHFDGELADGIVQFIDTLEESAV